MSTISKELLRKLIKDETRPSTSEFSDGWNNALFCVLQAMDSGALSASPAEGWIACSERLPERNQNVLYWHKPPAGYGPHGYPAIADEWRDENHLKFASHWKPIKPPELDYGTAVPSSNKTK